MCLEGIAVRFVETGTAEGIDTSCVSTMQRPPFAIDEADMRSVRRAGEGGEEG